MGVIRHDKGRPERLKIWIVVIECNKINRISVIADEFGNIISIERTELCFVHV